jgi:hypothetical protein
VTDCCEHGDEPSGSVKGGEFLDLLLQKVSVPWSSLVS